MNTNVADGECGERTIVTWNEPGVHLDVEIDGDTVSVFLQENGTSRHWIATLPADHKLRRAYERVGKVNADATSGSENP